MENISLFLSFFLIEVDISLNLHTPLTVLDKKTKKPSFKDGELSIRKARPARKRLRCFLST
jgi:hypothetical protein